MSFELPALPYSYIALEPAIDAMTLEIHYTKHHATYLKNLNAALDKYPDIYAKSMSIAQILSDLSKVPEDIRTAVRNNGGGYYNHILYWSNMGPNAGGEPQGDLATAINASFGNFAAFKQEVEKAGMGRFGSGWAWLSRKKDGSLMVHSTPNQDCPLSEGHVPLLGVDVWEHAYYLKYQNRRADYLANWWSVVNWDEVGRRFANS
jgi:superoxide dismutase, Fe-Mn family